MQITPTEKSVCKDFELNNLGKYHDLYVKSDILLLADVFENFRSVSKHMNLTLLNFFLNHE